MSYNYVVNIGYGLYEVKDGKMQPSAISGGKSLLIFTGETIEDCTTQFSVAQRGNKRGDMSHGVVTNVVKGELILHSQLTEERREQSSLLYLVEVLHDAAKQAADCDLVFGCCG